LYADATLLANLSKARTAGKPTANGTIERYGLFNTGVMI
jgi:hypothetical protein